MVPGEHDAPVTGGRPLAPEDDAPRTAPLSGAGPINLLALAQKICDRYREEFPDEKERYGINGYAWCVHDNQHLLNWGAQSVNGFFDVRQEVSWLARVLEARGFPVERLARNLDIGAAVIGSDVVGAAGVLLAQTLTDVACFVRSGEFVDYVPDD